MVALAVAVRPALAPACRNELPAPSARRWTGVVGRNVETGTLGLTEGGGIESPRTADAAGAGGGRSTSVQAAGLLGAGLSVPAGHGAWPSGVDATPGLTASAVSWVRHAAPGPDAGHCSEPEGTFRLMSSPVALDVHPCCEAVGLSTPAEHAAAPRWNARSAINTEAVAAAPATKRAMLQTTTTPTPHAALGRDLRSDKT